MAHSSQLNPVRSIRCSRLRCRPVRSRYLTLTVLGDFDAHESPQVPSPLRTFFSTSCLSIVDDLDVLSGHRLKVLGRADS